jgi:membrane peptidoglycan carboxypeptidase
MGGDHEYGHGDAPRDGSRAYGTGRRGYGENGPEEDEPDQPRGYGNRGYGEGQSQQSPPPTPPPPASGYGQSSGRRAANPSAQPPSGERGYGSPADARSYGPPSPTGYGQPVDSYGSGQGRGYGSRRSIPGEIVPPDAAAPGTRRMPAAPGPGQGPDPADVPAPPAPPRLSRVEERRAARNGGTAYAPGQERSDQYDRSAIDGRATRNGAGRRSAPGSPGGPDDPGGPGGPGGRAGARPPKKKTGYHKFFDYPRTNKTGWRHWTPSFKQLASFALGGFFLVIGLVAFEYESIQVPTAADIATQQSSIFQYADGATQFGSTGTIDRRDVEYQDIPMMMQNAIVAQEDKTFWTNPGVSYTGTARALLNDLTGGATQGGSTLTQEYVKNAFLTQAQTFGRKTSEIFISLKIAKTESKQTVMTNYLNTVFYGRDSYGIEAATKSWLGQGMSALADPANAALMAALVNQPTNFSLGWSPTESPTEQQYWQNALKVRWKDTLTNMLDYHYITQAEFDTAVAKFPNVIPVSDNTGETVQQQQMVTSVENWLGNYDTTHPGAPTPAQIEAGGYAVVSTFNQNEMNLAAKAVQDQLLSKLTPNDPYYSYDDSNLDPGLAAVDPATGDLVAFYGGTTDINNATYRQVQPGSTFKAFTLATAFQDGWSPNSFINGANPWPDKKNPNEWPKYEADPPVHNDDNVNGVITLKEATDASVNTAFVRLEMDPTNGVAKVQATAEKFGLNGNDVQGFNSEEDGCDNARFTLGICAADPARMADAYSAFPDNGSLHPLTEVLKIIEPSGSVWTPDTAPTQATDSNTAETVTEMLQGVTHSASGTAYGAVPDSGLQNIAGKTGTSTMALTSVPQSDMKYLDGGNFDTAAVWFNGYTTKLDVAVDISRWTTVDNQAVQLPVDNIHGTGAAYGAQFPMQIWAEFMHEMQSTSFAGDAPFPAPVPNPSATIMDSPSASASASATPTATKVQPSTPVDTLSPSATPTICSSDNGGGFLGLGGGNGNQCPTDSPSDSPSATPGNSASPPASPSPTTSSGFGGIPPATNTRKAQPGTG